MRAVTFFLIVFVSMLSVFLVATGEVQRWFMGGEGRRLNFDLPPDEPEVTENVLKFPYYDVERGVLGFTIRAELSQDQIGSEEKFDKIQHISLLHGTLDIPVEKGLGVGGPADDESPTVARGGQVLLEFESAEFHRDSADIEGEEETEDDKLPITVVLRDAKGRTSDGYTFSFEDLLFEYRDGKDGGRESHAFRTDKPVAIRSESFSLASPSGLRGSLRGDGKGLETLSFLPPVEARVDPQRAPMFRDAVVGEDTEPEPDRKTSSQVLAIASEGPLEVRSVAAKGDAPARTVISFRDNVVIRPADAADAASPGAANPQELAAGGPVAGADAAKLECQLLELRVRQRGRQPVPESAAATWPDGRVRAVFRKGGKDEETYVIDGERLDWVYRLPPEVEGDAKREDEKLDLASGVSEAWLTGNPTLTGGGCDFGASRALVRLTEGSVLLENVAGEIELVRRDEKDSEAAAGAAALPPLQGAAEPPEREEAEEAPTLPRRWRVRADEVEFFFPRDKEGKRPEFSHFVARSPRSGRVEIVSVADGKGVGEVAAAMGPLSLSAQTVVYTAKDRSFTFGGEPGEWPVLAQGKNRITARLIRLFTEKDDERALFEGDVQAQILELRALAAARPGGHSQEKPGDSSGGGATGDETGGAASASAGADKTAPVNGASKDAFERVADRFGGRSAFELRAAVLQAGFDRELGQLAYLRARGEGARPARLRSLPAEGETKPKRDFELRGADLDWNHTSGVAVVHGLAGGAGSRAPAESGSDPRDPVRRLPTETGGRAWARLQDGRVLADRITFDGRALVAHLEGHVSLESIRGKSGFVVHTGGADVEFYDPERDHPDSRPVTHGFLRDLREIKAFRARRASGAPILLIGQRGDGETTFRGRAEEAEWDGEKLELRLFGDEKQEVEIDDPHFTGPVWAREVSYRESDNRLVLRGDVEGELTQRHAAGEDAADDGVDVKHVWSFETTRLDVQLRRDRDSRSPELVSAHARGDVHLHDHRLGLQLLGDALDYESASRMVRIFSPKGRPQTFFRTKSESEGEGSSSARSDRITSQEIVLHPYEDPRARFGETRRWLLVVFKKDVKAAFFPPTDLRERLRPPAARGGKRYPTPGEAWKLDGEELVLYVDPAQGIGPKTVPWATCEGNVVFKSGEFTATASQAEYSEVWQRLTLEGRPARLTAGRDTFENSVITFRKDADHVIVEIEESASRRRNPRR